MLAFRQPVVFVDPVRDPSEPGRFAEQDGRLSMQQPFRVEDVVNLLVLHQAVRVDAGARHVEIPADERRHRRNVVVQLLPVVFADLGDHRRVHAVHRSAQRSVLHDHRFERHVSGALPDAEQRAVDRARAVEPCRGRVGDRLIKIVVAVPFEHFARHVRIMLQTVDDARHAARQRDFGIRHAVAHRIAGANPHRDARIARHLHQLVDERHDKAVKVRARNVLQMAARHDARLECAGNGSEILIHRLLACHLQLPEDVIVAARNEDAGFTDAEVAHKGKILFRRANPRGDLRKAQAERLTLFDRIPILLAVDEKFRLPDDPVRPAEATHQPVEVDNLAHAVRLARLLPVPKRRVRDPDLARHAHRHAAVVERYARHFGIIIQIPV